MGIIIAKFRVWYLKFIRLTAYVFVTLQKKKTTEEVLETLDKEIKSIETYRINTEQTQKRIVGRFLLISVIVYSLTAFLFYFYFFPASFYDRLFYIIPLACAPVMYVVLLFLLNICII